MVGKIIKIGNSTALTFPLKYLEEIGLKVGDDVNVEIGAARKTIIIKPLLLTNKRSST